MHSCPTPTLNANPAPTGGGGILVALGVVGLGIAGYLWWKDQQAKTATTPSTTKGLPAHWNGVPLTQIGYAIARGVQRAA